MEVKKIIPLFDKFLAAQGLSFDGVIIGGAALALLGVVSRQTRDCDVLDPLLPKELIVAANEFALALRSSGEFLQDDWLNHTPESLSRLLPSDWPLHLQLVFKGSSLTLHTLGRLDLLRTKLFALCDRGSDLPDCIALNPTLEEIHELTPWVQEQDSNSEWPKHVTIILDDLARRLGHGI